MWIVSIGGWEIHQESIVCTATFLFQYRQEAWIRMYVVPEQILLWLKMSLAFTLALIFLATLYPKRRSAKGVWWKKPESGQLMSVLKTRSTNLFDNIIFRWIRRGKSCPRIPVESVSPFGFVHNIFTLIQFQPQRWGTCDWSSRRSRGACPRGILMPVPWGGRVPPTSLK